MSFEHLWAMELVVDMRILTMAMQNIIFVEVNITCMSISGVYGDFIYLYIYIYISFCLVAMATNPIQPLKQNS